ncbi:MAG: hypothetical protein PHO93_01025 [Candidatus Saccharimonadaceae bacterium]|nr:hypothetical protein [Candidatus Saccharimonadaceae bacterium]
MEMETGAVEAVTKSDLLELGMATWNQPRTPEQILGFIARREKAIGLEQ